MAFARFCIRCGAQRIPSGKRKGDDYYDPYMGIKHQRVQYICPNRHWIATKWELEADCPKSDERG